MWRVSQFLWKPPRNSNSFPSQWSFLGTHTATNKQATNVIALGRACRGQLQTADRADLTVRYHVKPRLFFHGGYTSPENAEFLIGECFYGLEGKDDAGVTFPAQVIQTAQYNP